MSSNESDSEITEHEPDFKQGMFQQILDARNEEEEKSIVNEMASDTIPGPFGETRMPITAIWQTSCVL